MLKLLPISLLLFVKFGEINSIPIDLDVALTSQVDIITLEKKLPPAYSYTTAFGTSLYTTLKNATHLRILNSYTMKDECNIAVDPVEDSIQGKFRAKILVDDDVYLAVWGVKSKYDGVSDTKVNYTTLIVDIFKCTYFRLSTPEEVFPRGWFNAEKHSPMMIMFKFRRDYLDIFYPSLTTCAPCRYWLYDGTKLELEHQLQSEPVELTVSSIIEVPPAYSRRSHLYYYVANFKNGSAVIKQIKLDDHSVIRQRLLNHTINEVAVSPKKGFDLHFCYTTPQLSIVHNSDGVSSTSSPAHSDAHRAAEESNNHVRVRCEVLDIALKSILVTELILPENQQPTSLSLVVNREYVHLITLQFSKPNNHEAFYLYQSALDTQPMTNYTLVFGEMKNTHSEKWIGRSFYGLDVDDVNNSRYCLEITRQFSNESDTLSSEGGVFKCIANEVYSRYFNQL